jgi:hypothetical protein
MNEFTYTFPSGLTLECEYEYEEANRDVGFPDCAYLIHARAGGVDILEILDSALIAAIEEAAKCSMRESRY